MAEKYRGQVSRALLLGVVYGRRIDSTPRSGEAWPRVETRANIAKVGSTANGATPNTQKRTTATVGLIEPTDAAFFPSCVPCSTPPHSARRSRSVPPSLHLTYDFLDISRAVHNRDQLNQRIQKAEALGHGQKPLTLGGTPTPPRHHWQLQGLAVQGSLTASPRRPSASG